jgi:Ca2+-binding RTX toxin-like protein
VGGDDNDTLIGGAGNNTLIGGTGIDYFKYEGLVGQSDFIADFAVNQDKLDLRTLGVGDSNLSFNNNTLTITLAGNVAMIALYGIDLSTVGAQSSFVTNNVWLE